VTPDRKRQVKVMQIITGLGCGGAEKVVLDLTRALNEQGLDVNLVSLSPDLSARDLFGHAEQAVSVFDLSGSGRMTALRALRTHVRAFSPDVVHAHMFHGLLAAVLARPVLGQAPALCFTSHCYDQAFPPGRSRFMRTTRRMRAADILFAPDQHPHLNTRRTEIIGNGIPVSDSPPPRQPWAPSRPVRLVAIGRLAEQKDPLGLIRTFGRLGRNDLSLDFFGDGPLRQACAALIAELGLGDRVRLRGITANPRAAMAAADILLLHSRFEGLPMVLLEAGSLAMPIIATPVGAVPMLLSGGRGTLAATADFAPAILQMISDPQAALQQGLRLRTHVRQHHSLSAVAEQHAALYRAVMGD
jgi:glycosyltransferase involved in cell wall biosynthesis